MRVLLSWTWSFIPPPPPPQCPPCSLAGQSRSVSVAMTTKKRPALTSAHCSLVGKPDDRLTFVFFLGEGVPTTCPLAWRPCIPTRWVGQVGYSCVWMVLGEAAVKEESQDWVILATVVPVNTLLIKAIPWGGGECAAVFRPWFREYLNCLVLRTSDMSGILHISLHVVFHLVLTKTLCTNFQMRKPMLREVEYLPQRHSASNWQHWS